MGRDRVRVLDRTRLTASARAHDGFYSTFVVRKISRHVTALALRLGLRPNEITVGSMLIAFLAAALFARGEQLTTVIAAVLLQVSLVVDCVDGEVARYTSRFSAVGAWLDGVGDRLKEFLVYAGLAAGYGAWSLAAALLVVQVFRHHVDFAFSAVRRDLATPEAAKGLALGQRAVTLSESTSERRALMWAKRVVIMPIGERWLLLSVVSAAADGRQALLILLITCSVAGAYTTAGRILRALAHARSPLDPGQLVLMSAALPPPLEPLPRQLTAARLAGLLPPLLRGLEIALLLGLTLSRSADVVGVAFFLSIVVALDGYDLVYRLKQDQAPSARWRRSLMGGILPRTAIEVALVCGAATATARSALGVLATALACVCVVELTQWLRSAGSAA